MSGLAFATFPGISFSQSNPDVVVIGAGSSGLAATAELIRRGIPVLCIEAMNRIGGRCYTDLTSFNGLPADHGAHWLDVKERLAIAIKEIVEKNGASFAFPSQSIYIEKK